MLRLDNLAVRVDSFNLTGISLMVPRNGYAILMGNTGSGKTTLLETICGLRSPHNGAIYVGDRNLTDLPPRERGIGYLPQDITLFNTMTVSENIGFALMLRKRPVTEIIKQVSALADLLGISQLLQRWPASLSGGEKQRVALGRALAAQPQVLLLDEPFSALDDHTREDMYVLMKTVRKATGTTVLHVTHSRFDAQELGDVQFQLDGGKIISHTKTASDK